MINVQSSPSSYISPAVKISPRSRQGRQKKTLELGKSLALVERLGKTALIVVPVFLLLQLALVSLNTSIDQDIQTATKEQLLAEDHNINLLAQKATLYAPASIEKLAAERLALYSPVKDQVGRYNRRYATFSFL